jgi:hypothetical protein
MYGTGPGGQGFRRVKIRICRPCNGLMGRVFEEPASQLLKPVIYGEESVFSPSEQEIVGAWIAKTSLLGCLAGIGPEDWGYDITRHELLRLQQTQSASPHLAVRIGITSSEGEEGEPSDDAYLGNLLPNGRAPKTALFAVSTLGALVWETAVGSIPEISRFSRWTAGRTLRLVPVWPTKGRSVRWPPEEPLTRTQIASMRRAYVEGARPGVVVAAPWRRRWKGADV